MNYTFGRVGAARALSQALRTRGPSWAFQNQSITTSFVAANRLHGRLDTISIVKRTGKRVLSKRSARIAHHQMGFQGDLAGRTGFVSFLDALD